VILCVCIGSRLINSHGRAQPTVVFRLMGLFLESVACGHTHTDVVTQPGDVYGWGQQGADDLRVVPCFERLPEPEPDLSVSLSVSERERDREKEAELLRDGRRVVSIACGAHHTLALSREGSVWWR
jgi:alpha-tubulin suppressor-like RCC1 family protein